MNPETTLAVVSTGVLLSGLCSGAVMLHLRHARQAREREEIRVAVGRLIEELRRQSSERYTAKVCR